LNPKNKLIAELSNGKKVLCIGDIGLSKYDLDTIKQIQTTLGYNSTPFYKTPEVINMKEPTSKVDIWALGIIFY
jgi:serine/threonine protein kinase